MKKSFIHLVNNGMNQRSASLRKVSKEAGLDPSYFSKVLSGKRSPPSDEKVLTRLAKFLDIDPLHLIVSTGIIPSELQSIMEKPEILESLCKKFGQQDQGSLHFKTSVKPQKKLDLKPKKSRNIRETSSAILKSPELSEDLL